jgi:hypothetical protein
MAAPRKPLDVKGTPQPRPHGLDLLEVPAAVHQNIISGFLNHKKSAGLSRSCRQLHSIYQPALTQQQFLQAVVDDQIETVQSILNKHPSFLLDAPKQKLEIESKYTWQ